MRTYRVGVLCKGRITSNPKLIEFSCSVSKDDNSLWEASIDKVGDGKDYMFNPCLLTPTSEINGTETIHTEVTIRDPKMKKDDSRLFKIEIDV